MLIKLRSDRGHDVIVNIDEIRLIEPRSRDHGCAIYWRSGAPYITVTQSVSEIAKIIEDRYAFLGHIQDGTI